MELSAIINILLILVYVINAIVAFILLKTQRFYSEKMNELRAKLMKLEMELLIEKRAEERIRGK